MKFKRVTHYIPNTHCGEPSFLLVLEDNDGKEKIYLSTACLFIEYNKTNMKQVRKDYELYDWEERLLAGKIKTKDLTDARFLFYGSNELTEFDCNMPNVEDGALMFSNCKNLKTVKGKFPKMNKAAMIFHASPYINVEYMECNANSVLEYKVNICHSGQK